MEEGGTAGSNKRAWVRVGDAEGFPVAKRYPSPVFAFREGTLAHKGKAKTYIGVKNGSGAPSVGLNTTFTFWPIFNFSMSQSTKLVCSDGPSFSVT